jgi:hypothetical protein
MKASGFLEEDNGSKSFVRLQSLLLTILFIAVVVYQTLHSTFNFEVLLLLAAFATGPKVVQKFVEAKGNGFDSSSSSKTTEKTVETKTA